MITFGPCAYNAAYRAALETECMAGTVQRLSEQEFADQLSEWDCMGIYQDGTPIGSAFFKGGEGHIAILEEYHKCWANKTVMLEIARRWFSSGKVITAKVNPENKPALRFVESMGLLPAGIKDNFIIYAATQRGAA